ncbi:hypothetical protein BGZ80_007728 [Entomortierella chlamydospora]|uniref:Vacuolar protein sorting-associated protein n=1 Tax=Entomortierella chlamydospora TaxID=101097 RepID=A0A9P6N3X1_9FUNG|nr:hypothetical protein BGZ79_001645 [Entomortierella chlamydospora]KAG0023854.1 hypothetical protein BGZ80_007728 [Entomortierella chlamydospora]
MLESLVASLLNRFIGPYVTNLNVNQLNIGIWNGDVKLTNLQLKKDALDKFSLPVDVTEGYLGELTLSIPWSNLKSKPVKVYINNVYLLCVPKGESEYNPEEEAARAQALKEDRLENAELLNTKKPEGMDDEEKKNATFLNQVITKVVDNLQVSINNIHIRYEDKMSDPKHPFSAGLTLSQLSAVSTDGQWVPTFIHDEANTIHKLATLDSLAMYWNTDSESLGGKATDEALKAFVDLIAKAEHVPGEHQYILKPVSGEGKIKINKRYGGDIPKVGVTLDFNELGFVFDDEQYKNVLMMISLFHSFIRQSEHRKFRPPLSVTPKKDPLAWFRYAGNAVLSQIHERNRKWTWAYFEERRDDRKAYVELYKNHKLGRNDVEEEERLKALEWKLSYDDIRLYRSIAKGALRREKILIEKKQAKEQPKGWISSWWYGSGSTTTETSEEEDSTTLTDAQMKQLYDVIDYDEKAALQANLEEAKDTILFAVNAKLKQGSFALKKDPHGINKTIFCIVFDTFLANFLQRTDNLAAGIALGGLTCIDSTMRNTLYPKIIRVKEAETKKKLLSQVSEGDLIFGGESSQNGQTEAEVDFNPFFSVKFEQNPLDGHADSVLEVKMRHLEILYNPKTVDTVLEFFKPPASEADSINALLEVAGDTLEGLAAQTRAGLEYALEEHKRLDLRVDMDAPVMIFPESCTDINALVAVLDVGHIFVESNLVSKEDLAVIENNHKRTLNETDFEKLEDLMYDRFVVQLSSTQLLVGQSVERCLQQIQKPSKDNDLHVIDKINMTFHVHLSILPQAPNLTKIKVFGDLPLFQVNFSDRKYKTLMRIIDLVVPKDPEAAAPPPPPKPKSSRNITPLLGKSNYADDLVLADTSEGDSDNEKKEQTNAQLFQKTFQFSFKVAKFAVTLKKAAQDINMPERVLADLIIERFDLQFALRAVDMKVDIVLGSLYVEDKFDPNSLYPYLISSDADGTSPATGKSEDLVRVSYTKVNTISPEYITKYKGIDATVDISFSTVTMILTRKSVLALFDFILTTFTSPAPPQNQVHPAGDQNMIKATGSATNSPPPAQDTMKVKVKMTSIHFILNNDGQRLATMALQQCDVAVLMKPSTMRVNVRLGNFSLTDDIRPGKQQILAIQGEELADFAYETFDPKAAGYPGYDASVFLRAGSLQLTFLEESIKQLLDFSAKFARMHVLYDTARNAAVNQAQALQTTVSKFHFDVQISTPIVILPKDEKSRNAIVANLGEISIRNEFADDANVEGGFLDQMNISIRSINLLSLFYFDNNIQELQIIENVDIEFDMTRAARKDGLSRPDMELVGRMSDVSMNLTELQYKTLYGISMSVARAFGGGNEVDADALALAASAGIPSAPPPPPQPPVKSTDEKRTSIDLVFNLPQITLEIYHGDATQKEELRDCSFSKFSLTKTDFKYKMLTDSTMQAELTIQDLIINDTRRNVKTKFREIIPANLHDSPQISVSLNSFDDNSMLVLLNVDSPKVIFHLEYIFALQNYFMSAFTPDSSEAVTTQANKQPQVTSQSSSRPPTSANGGRKPTTSVAAKPAEPPKPEEQGASLHYRVSVISPEIILLANAASSSTDAIILSAHQVVMSQQETMTLIVDRVGMVLCKMDKREDTSIRFIDNFDIALSMGTRSPTPGHQLTNITLDVRPLVLRLSYRDAMLIMDIVNKVTEFQSKAQPAVEDPSQASKQHAAVGPEPRAIEEADHKLIATSAVATVPSPNSKRLVEEASFVSTRETLKGAIQGLQLILIDDLYSLPLLDVRLDRFDLEVKDWSSEMKVDTSLRPSINYFNVRNSHWEPLLEPWQFVVHVSKVVQPANMMIEVFSKQDLNINITHTFIETVLQVMTTIQKEPEHATSVSRETLVPYILRNRTGYPLHVWAESENNTDIVVHKIQDRASMPWRFDDWRKMRETVASKKNTLGIQFDGVPWESLKDVPVEQEGRYLYVLRPKLNKVSHRIAVDIRIKNNVKVVTFSSALLVQNATSLPIEVVVADEKRKHLSSAQKIAPGEDFSVPIEDAYKNRLLVRPDPGFNYNWSLETIFWRDLATQQQRQQRYGSDNQSVSSVSCRPIDDPQQQSFRFQVRGGTDNFDPIAKDYPFMTIRLSAPVEIENLLPYNIRYTVMEKTSPKHSGTVLTSYLRKGGVSPLHTVDVRNLMLLSIVVENTPFGPSEYAIVSSHDPDELPVEDTLTLVDPDGLKLMLGISRHVIPDSGGAVKFSIYCPYVILNKTGLDLVFKAKSFMQNAKIAAGQGQGRIVQNKALPLMFSYGKSENGNRVLIQVAGNSFWSRPVSFEAVGSIMEIAVQAAEKKEELHLGLSVDIGKGKYALTKVVTITPRFILKNNLNEDVYFREHGSNNVVTLLANQHAPLRYMRQGSQKLLSLRLSGVTTRWTAPFTIDEMGKMYVTILRSDGEVELIRVYVTMEVATIFIILSKEEGRWPYRIDNKSSWDISFFQHNSTRAESSSSSTASFSSSTPKTYKLKAGETVAYSWDLPSMKEKSLVLSVNGREREVNLQEIGSLVPFKFPAGDANSILSIDVVAEGPTHVLVLADYDSKQSIFKQRSSSRLLEGDDTESTKEMTKEGFEVIDVDAVVTFSFQIRLECIGISVLNQRMQELVYLSMSGLETRYTDSNMYQSVNMMVKWLQIDNQLYGGSSPIILCPTQTPKDGKDASAHPTLHSALVRAKDDTHGVVYFKYFSVLLQELTVSMDEDFLFTLLEFSKFNVPGWTEDPDKIELCQESLELPKITTNDDENQLFFEVLHLHPMKVNLSFMRSERVNIDEAQHQTSSSNPIMYLFNVLTMAIGNIDAAPITLNALLLENARASGPVLIDLLQRHYGQEFFYQIHLILGSIEFLGNPVGLFNNLSSGVADFFYEPYQGFVMGDRPQDFGLGLARGTSSLLKKTVFGLSDSLAKISGSVSKGLSAATMDKSFQERRRMGNQRNAPKHALSGLSQGATSLANGFVSGVTGIVEQPLVGAQNGGVEGFFKGVGIGLVGAVTKPLVGVFDFTTNVTSGIRNTTTVFDKDVQRKRTPRHVPKNGILTLYDPSKALGQYWLKQVDSGKYFYDDYIAHLILKGDNMAAMLTSRRIMVFRAESLKVEWELEFADIHSIAPYPRGISIVSRRDRQENFIPIFDQSSLQWFSGKIEEKVNQFNAELKPLE